MGELISITGTITTLAIILISFGVLYGVLKSRQDNHSDALKEVRADFKELRTEIQGEFRDFRKEFEKFRRQCKGICKLDSGVEEIEE